MTKVYLDTETCGLHSMPVLLQYAIDNGDIVLYDIWLEPVGKTKRLIESFCEMTVVGFNLAFDWFQLQKLYCVWNLLPEDWVPVEHIDEIALLEDEAKDGPCLKPAGALDLLLHSRKGPYQALMARSDIRIRRVPTALAYALRDELEDRVKLDDIYFAKSADKEAPRWKVFDVFNADGELREDVKDVVLKFHPAGGLKFLAEYAMGYEPKFHYEDVEPPKSWYPIEYGYAPTATAVSSPEKDWEVYEFDKLKGEWTLKGVAWPATVKRFIDHWATHKDAREYATDDIVYTRALDEHFGFPTPSDDDSILACHIASVRWRGFAIDIDAIKALRDKEQRIFESAPINVNKPSEVREYLMQFVDEVEALELRESTGKKTLASYMTMSLDEPEDCSKCWGNGCTRCNHTGTLSPMDKPAEWWFMGDAEWKRVGNHPMARHTAYIQRIKSAKKFIESLDKLLRAGRFHADFNIIGTKSARMSGTGGLNAQGQSHGEEYRSCFTLAGEGMLLSIGDFDSFEITLADAVYDDPKLRELLLSGKKIHALFAMQLYEGMTYEEIMEDKDCYGNGKTAIFAMVYGGDWNTLVRNQGFAEEVARAAYEGFMAEYPGINAARSKTFDKFCSMRQPGGAGTQVYWADPADYVESFLGFRRFFTLENQICRALFDLAQHPPKGWKQVKVPVQRHREGRVQTAAGATASALYAAAFNMQATNMRAAANHEIQSPGGQITKNVQRKVADLQPVGVHPFVVMTMNVHDELGTVHTPELTETVTETIRQGVEAYRPQVPLIGMTWQEDASNWASKKEGAKREVKIRCPELMNIE